MLNYLFSVDDSDVDSEIAVAAYAEVHYATELNISQGDQFIIILCWLWYLIEPSVDRLSYSSNKLQCFKM